MGLLIFTINAPGTCRFPLERSIALEDGGAIIDKPAAVGTYAGKRVWLPPSEGTGPRRDHDFPEHVYGMDRLEEAGARVRAIEPFRVDGKAPLFRVEQPSHPVIRTHDLQFPHTGRSINHLSGDVIFLPQLEAFAPRIIEAARRNWPPQPGVFVYEKFGALANGVPRGLPSLWWRVDAAFGTTVREEGVSPAEGRSRPWTAEQRKHLWFLPFEAEEQVAGRGMARSIGYRSMLLPFDLVRLQLELPGIERPLRLVDFAGAPDYFTLDGYPHDDSTYAVQPLQAGENLHDVSAIVRAQRWQPGAPDFLMATDCASITPGYAERDRKLVMALPKEVDGDLGWTVAVEDADVGRAVAQILMEDGGLQSDWGPNSLHFKGEFSARAEAADGMWLGRERDCPSSFYPLRALDGEKLRKSLYYGTEGGLPYKRRIMLQPTAMPCTLANLGIRLPDVDGAREVFDHWYRLNGAAVRGSDPRVCRYAPVHGNEDKYFPIVRWNVVYLPLEHLDPTMPAQPLFAYGVLHATTTPGKVHGGNGALTITTELEGYPPPEMQIFNYDWPSFQRNPVADVRQRERFVVA